MSNVKLFILSSLPVIPIIVGKWLVSVFKNLELFINNLYVLSGIIDSFSYFYLGCISSLLIFSLYNYIYNIVSKKKEV